MTVLAVSFNIGSRMLFAILEAPSSGDVAGVLEEAAEGFPYSWLKDVYVLR